MFAIIIILINITLSNEIFVPADFSTIQEAINYASNEDTIKVSTGVYYENIIIDGKNILLVSDNENEETIIDGNQNGPTITCNNINNQYLTVRGFIIQNGSGQNINGATYGGGILSNNSNLILENLSIKNNSAFAGGGICFYSTESSNKHPYIYNCTIKNNLASEGGGVFIVNHSLSVYNSTIEENGMDLYGSGGGIQALLSNLELSNITINNNETRFGGGIYISNSSADFENVIIEENYSDSRGGGIWVGGQTNLSMYKTIIARNESVGFGGGIFVSVSNLDILNSSIIENIIDSNATGTGIYMDGGNASINNTIIYYNYHEDNTNPEYNIDGYTSDAFFEYDIKYSNIEGLNDLEIHGFGTISDNPLFIDLDFNDYHLMENSPCIDSGDPNIIDEDMTISDMGAYYYEQYIQGDLNNDLIINILDIIIAINTILNNDFIINADMNNDGNNNIQDIILIINLILS